MIILVIFIFFLIVVLCVEMVRKDKVENGNVYNFLEMVCILWFMLEYGLWIFFCLDKLKFVFDVLNLIDFVLFILYYC